MAYRSVTVMSIQRLTVATPLKWKVLCCMALELIWRDIHAFLKTSDQSHVLDNITHVHTRSLALSDSQRDLLPRKPNVVACSRTDQWFAATST